AACGGKSPSGTVPTAEVPPPAPAAPAPAAPAPAAPPAQMKPRVPTEADAFTKNCADSLAKAGAIRDQSLVGAGPHTIENTLEPFNELSRLLNNAGELSGLMHEGHPHAPVRDAARTGERAVLQFNSDLLPHSPA